MEASSNGREHKAARRRPFVKRREEPYTNEDTLRMRREIALEVLTEILEEIRQDKREADRSIANLLREVVSLLEKG